MNVIYGPGPEAPRPLSASRDMAGLKVDDVEDRPIGELVGSLAEEQTGLIRYLDLSLRQADRHVLVPIGHTRLERASEPPRVRLRAATYEDLLTIPAYAAEEGPPLAPPYEHELLQAHGRLFYGERYYTHPAFDHAGVFDADRPIEADEAEAPPPGRVMPLRSLPRYRVKPGEPDIRGWGLVDGAREPLGMVGDLLVDPEAQRVRYVEVELPRRDCSVLLPVGFLHIDREQSRVQAPALEPDDLAALPVYEGGELPRDDELRIRNVLEARLTGRRYYLRPDFARR